MKKLCVFTLYSEKGASSQYRSYIFKEDLEKNYHVRWFYFWDDMYVTKYMQNKNKYAFIILIKYIISAIKRCYHILFIASKCDIVFFQKACIPKIKINFLFLLKKKGIRIIFDVDDAIYLDSKDNSNIVASYSDVVICGNKVLRNHYSEFSKKCIIIPTVEKTYKYDGYWSDTFNRKSIGWIGSKNTVKNLELIVNPINNIVKKHPEVNFYIISNCALDYTERIPNCHLIVWDKEKYISDLAELTVGIMPLVDNEYNNGKCGFKLVQYLNMKKPVIGSNVGVNSEIIGRSGIIVNSEMEWEAALEKLLFDENAYKQCVTEIENEFFEKYHFKFATEQLLNTLKGIDNL